MTKGTRLAGGTVLRGNGEESSEMHTGTYCHTFSPAYRRLAIGLPRLHHFQLTVEGTDPKGMDVVGVNSP
jgi:hypothetical protein